MKALAIAAIDLRRLVRWRANVFFLLVLPMMIILLLGAAFGGSQSARLGVLDLDRGTLARELTAALAAKPATTIVRYKDLGALQSGVAHGDVDAGLVIPRRYDAGLAHGAGVPLGFFARPNTGGQQVRLTVQAVVAGQGRVLGAAQLLSRRERLSFAAALARARVLAARTPQVAVVLTAPGGGPYTTASGRFEQSASTELVLFIFLTSMTGAAYVIETRRLGVARRILSTPTSVAQLLLGQLLGRLAVALVQALIIVLGTMLLFGVTWGDPLGTAAVVLAFSLVGTGIAVLVGSLCATEQQAQPVSFLLGLGLAALGGSMVPLEVFPATMRSIAHVTPHAWANDAFSKLLKHGGDLVSVLPQIGVLLGFAAVVITLAAWQLRRAITA